eukprot:TRINITY_DN47674_c0_g1_i1.p1 TRINITY_DN47674_c0_g1~~TRINITY_DN47674_c0_g1_i1.p1  ORF type:complete len:230 (+),score=68.74 TRINITY_DN47674_c0_g1_i1:151-840(+)
MVNKFHGIAPSPPSGGPTAKPRWRGRVRVPQREERARPESPGLSSYSPTALVQDAYGRPQTKQHLRQLDRPDQFFGVQLRSPDGRPQTQPASQERPSDGVMRWRPRRPFRVKACPSPVRRRHPLSHLPDAFPELADAWARHRTPRRRATTLEPEQTSERNSLSSRPPFVTSAARADLPELFSPRLHRGYYDEPRYDKDLLLLPPDFTGRTTQFFGAMLRGGVFAKRIRT